MPGGHRIRGGVFICYRREYAAWIIRDSEQPTVVAAKLREFFA
jgi:hypothetical protein